MLTEEDVPASIEELSQWLVVQAPQVDAAALLAAASGSDLNTARLKLRIALPTLNAAIAELGPPYRPLRKDEGIAQEFRHYVAVHRREILDALRAGYLPAFRAGAPLTGYVERRDLTTLHPNSVWSDECLQVEPDLMRDWVNQWLADAGAPRLGMVSKLRPVDELREANRAALLGRFQRTANLIWAWEVAHNMPVSGLPGAPCQLADEAGGSGLLDFGSIDDQTAVAWLQHIERWPGDMPLTLSADDLGLSHAEVDSAQHAYEQERRRRHDERRRISIDDTDMSAEEENYEEIVAAVRAGIDDDFLTSTGGVSLSPLDQPRSTTPGGNSRGLTAARRSKLSEIQTAAVGLAGEILALEWLKANYDGVDDGAWVSGYRNLVLGDGLGDDTLGYDLIVEQPRTRLFFEVKASPREPGEFVLTATEVARARSLKKRERYYLLYVAHALNSDLRHIYKLPNPLDPKSARFFRAVGEGLRYRFDLQPRN